MDSAGSEAHHWAEALKLLLGGPDIPPDYPPMPLPKPGSPGDGDDVEAEEQREEHLATADTWYYSLELILRPTLRRYGI